MRLLYLVLLSIFPLWLTAQNKAYAEKIIQVLGHDKFHGRAYVSHGNEKAAVFVQREMKRAGLRSIDNNPSLFQHFSIDANTFPGKMSLFADKKELKPGIDFAVHPSCPGISGKYDVVSFFADTYNDSIYFSRFFEQNFSKLFVVIDPSAEANKEKRSIIESLGESNGFKSRGVIILTDGQPTFGAATWQNSIPIIYIKRSEWNYKTRSITLDIEAKFEKDYQTQNIVGVLPGKTDSFVVVTAHYDHIGRMGRNTYFPGANDNASGVAMLLDIAHKLGQQKEKPRYTYVFISFSGEESGLVGSFYFVQHPLIDLSKVRFTFNLDMVGSGDEGATLVNGVERKQAFELMTKINTDQKLLADLKPRAMAPNSDHFPFHKAGVQAFYLYTRGAYKFYHSPLDSPENLKLNSYDKVFRLIYSFITTY